MMEQVVQDGTAVTAGVPGYTVAGKTGTAQIPDPVHGGYIPGAYMATFAGFAPAENPALSAIVVLDQPDARSTAASWPPRCSPRSCSTRCTATASPRRPGAGSTGRHALAGAVSPRPRPAADRARGHHPGRRHHGDYDRRFRREATERP